MSKFSESIPWQERPALNPFRYVPVRYLGVVGWICFVNLLFIGRYQYDWSVYAKTSLLAIFYVAVFAYVCRAWSTKVRLWFPEIPQTRQRVLITFLGYVVLTISIITVFLLILESFQIQGLRVTPKVYLGQFIIAFVCIAVIGVVFEINYFLNRYGEAIKEAEAVKKAGIQSQYDSLKNQVNPHFLFNSLNSLSSLITEDREKAGEFLDELSSVYRYILQANNTDLTSLRAEMNFLQSYLFLLKTRYGNAISFHLEIDDAYFHAQLPPLTMQTLVENAIQHNIILPEQPLYLSFCLTAGGRLLVTNNIQRKNLRVAPGQSVMANVASRFRQLGLAEPKMTDDGQLFSVELPLKIGER